MNQLLKNWRIGKMAILERNQVFSRTALNKWLLLAVKGAWHSVKQSA